jgi:hypothetical protein
MKPRIILLISGILLIFLSVQSDTFQEKVYQSEMEQKYKIIELNEMYAGIPTRYQFGNRVIDTNHILKDEPAFRDAWSSTINLADIYITIDEEEIAALKGFPVEIEKDGLKVNGLNQYGNFVSYWLILDKEINQESFAIVLQTTKEIIKNNMDGYIPREEQDYMLIIINEDGKVKKENFSYKTKSELQTKLLPPMDEGPAGYQTDQAYSYPSGFSLISLLFIPLLFIIGIVLTLSSIILIIMKYLEKRENVK